VSVVVAWREVEGMYPDAPRDFVPTHRVRLCDARTGEVLREDLVHLDPADARGIRFARTPLAETPTYAVIPGGKWQCLERHGVVREESVVYRPDYVRPSERDGFVYFVQAGQQGPIKIGWSQDVPRRIAELQVANASRLSLVAVVPGKMRDEATTHERFAHLRLGAEWFQDAPELRAYLRECGDSPIEEP